MAEFLDKRSSDTELAVSSSPNLPVVSIADLDLYSVNCSGMDEHPPDNREIAPRVV